MDEITFTPFMSLANSAKSQHGNDLRYELEKLLLNELAQGRIKSYACKYTVGRRGHSQKQFYAPFMIQFEDDDRWIIYSTTSLRDRIKMDHWDAFNIKASDCRVKAAYLVYPADVSEKERTRFVRKDSQYRSGEEYSAIDGLMPCEKLLELIRNKANKHYESLYPPNGVPSHGGGKYYDYVGRAFEREIAEVISNDKYLKAWQQGKEINEPHFVHYKMMMSVFGVSAEGVAKIEATANHEDIGDLPSGGAPKTDVVARITFRNGKSELKTISCKRSIANEVSAHQYKADDFAEVLNPDDEELRRNLNYFQLAGNFRDMPVGAAERLEEIIKPHLEKLCYWVVSGKGTDCKPWQVADYVVSYRPSDNTFAIHTAKEYVDWLMNECPRRKGGTPFSWTYQGKRGANIQLKMPIMPRFHVIYCVSSYGK